MSLRFLLLLAAHPPRTALLAVASLAWCWVIRLASLTAVLLLQWHALQQLSRQPLPLHALHLYQRHRLFVLNEHRLARALPS